MNRVTEITTVMVNLPEVKVDRYKLKRAVKIISMYERGAISYDFAASSLKHLGYSEDRIAVYLRDAKEAAWQV